MPIDERRLKELFEAAADLVIEERASFLDRECENDLELRERLEALLAADARGKSTLDLRLNVDGPIETSESQRPQSVEEAPQAEPAAGDEERTLTWHGGQPQPQGKGGTRPSASRFGDYEILAEIARGGMGVVFRARQIKLNRVVALKMILGGLLVSQDQVRRFEIEAEAAAKLDHPGIVPIFEVGERDGVHYYSMGYVAGESLSARLTKGPFPSREAAELIRQAALAVAYAHQRGIIHRDLKPSNILLDGSRPRITDFGLARLVEADSDLTESGVPIGTPSYMPPEQAKGRMGEVGKLADVYSLGATLYCLLTGRPPFQAATSLETQNQVISREPAPPRQLNPAIHRDMETISLKCLQKDPSRRYPSAIALAEDLQRVLEGRPIEARPISNAERLVRWCRRNPRVSILAGALVLAIMGGLTGTTIGLVRADSQRKRAESERDLKDDALKKETAALAAEQRAHQAADTARIAAINALRKVTDKFVAKRLTSQVELTAEDRAFVRDVRDQYESLATISGDGAEQRELRAEGVLRMGLLQLNLSELPESEASLVNAISLYKTLVEEFPTNLRHQRHFAEAQVAFGGILARTSRVEIAEERFQETIALYRNIIKQGESDREHPDDLDRLANAHQSLGALYQSMNRPKEAEGAYLAVESIYEDLSARFPQRADFRFGLATIRSNLGLLQFQVGRFDDSESNYRKSLKELMPPNDENDDRPEYRMSAAAVHLNFATLLDRTGRGIQAEEHYLAAIAIQNSLVRDFPLVPLFSHELAITLCNFGNWLDDANRPEDARTFYEDAIAKEKRLVDGFGKNVDYRHQLGSTKTNLAALHFEQNRIDESRAVFLDGFASLRSVLTDSPDYSQSRLALVFGLRNYAAMCRTHGQNKDALEAYGEAVDHLDYLAMSGSANPAFGIQAATAKIDMAMIHQADGDLSVARRELQECLERVENMPKASRELPIHQATVDRAYYLLVQICARMADRHAAFEIAEKMCGMGTNPPVEAFNAACALARCGPILARYDVLSTEDREKEILHYANRAMEMLIVSVSKGFGDLERINSEQDLNSLRSREDFRKLVAELEMGSPAKSGRGGKIAPIEK